MPWFDHPAYRPVRDGLIDRFRSEVLAFRSLKHVVFLCGGFKSVPRDFLFKYLNEWATDALVFQADDVWARIAASTPLNALDVEGRLADLADAVIIIVESPGTFAELGAFSSSGPLRKKLLPILDAKYQHQPSFINTGPVPWVDADSLFRPSLWVDLDSILSAADQITQRLERLVPPGKQKLPIEDLVAHKKHLLFLLRDIVAAIGPATAAHVARYLRAILGIDEIPDVGSLLGLGESLDLMRSLTDRGTPYYFVEASDDLRPFLRKKYFDLSDERAKVVSVLQTIGIARDILLRLPA